MISCPIRLENNQVWDNGLRPVGSESLDWQLGPLGFGYILQLRCCQATSSKNAHHNTRTDVPPPARPPKYVSPLAKIHAAACPGESAGASSHPGARHHQGKTQELHASPLPRRYPPKFVVLMLAIYYVLYSIDIISVLDVQDNYTDD